MVEAPRTSRPALSTAALLVVLFGSGSGAYAQSEPLCKVAADPDYGLTKDRPIQVGGSPMYGAARQRRYLSALRGPKGEALTVERLGSGPGPDPDTLVDLYRVSYEGLDTPRTLYLDWYHYTEPFAPQGFTCGTQLELGTPPPDPFEAEKQVAALAATVAVSRGFRSPPVPLGENGRAGLVLDPFRLQSRRGAAAPSAQAGAGLTNSTAVVIHPLQCDGRSVPPKIIALVNRQGREFPAAESISEISRVAAFTPGEKPAPGTLAAVFQGDPLGAGLDVRVTYADAGCAGEPATRTWEIAYSGAKLVDAPMPARPADDKSGVPWIALQVVIDHQGMFQEARALGGPEPLVRAAIEAIKAWKVLPARANGAPLTTPVVLMVSFAATPQGR